MLDFYDFYRIYLIASAIVTLIGVIVCPIIAHRKGRSVLGWIFGGWALGVVGVIIVSCLPRKQ